MSDASRRALARAAACGLGAAALVVAATSVAAAFFARRIVSPDRADKPDDVEVVAVTADSVTLRAQPETVAPGRFGMWLDGGAGHARLGDVLDHDQQAGTVTRRLLGVDQGLLHAGGARWNQYFYAGTPAAVSLPFEDVLVAGDLGALPAWFVPPAAGVPSRDTWAVLVHGRGATREESLRALPVLHRLGFASLVVSYRNDRDAMPSRGGRYHLGESEWLDVEAAVLHAVSGGAQGVVLVGWSMGGAIALQLISRSWTADRVRAVLLDSPVIDWRDVLDHHARVNGLPAAIGRLSQSVLEHAHARRLAALESPLSLDRMDWVARASELTLPILLLHSDDDEFVPAGPSRRLAAARSDLVTLVLTPGARHTQEWNVDPEGWDTAVARFLLDL